MMPISTIHFQCFSAATRLWQSFKGNDWEHLRGSPAVGGDDAGV
jgi:hypothetical protein